MSDERPEPLGDVPASEIQMPPANYASTAGTQSSAVLRPLGVTVIMVLCLISGIGGLFSGCFAAGGIVFGETISSMAATVQDETQRKMQARLQETAREMMIPNIIMTIAGAAVSACFLACGLGLLKGKPWTLKLLSRTLLAAIVFELLRGVTVGWMQMKNGPIMQEAYRDMAKNSKGPDMSGMMEAFMWIGIAAWTMWAVVKIGLMIWGRVYVAGDTAKNYIAEVNKT
ncbi:hypothetical protein LF1_04310 [Rubripirellula obstinata]|uniref:Uncharacterized protein n=1 Tax=Rubripirellula obstinata TaxID=406547 RepID=A0A5B1CEC5_9BACT|nr:hypothetical protein [Rubripirellula obstinata]KAA1257940.1 hypothetical protein LF1_04310 [Rubripirellula obstinata]